MQKINCEEKDYLPEDPFEEEKEDLRFEFVETPKHIQEEATHSQFEHINLNRSDSEVSLKVFQTKIRSNPFDSHSFEF